MAVSSQGAEKIRRLKRRTKAGTKVPVFLLPDNSENIVRGDGDHKENEKGETDGVDSAGNSRFYWTVDNTFNNDEKEAPSVKRWDRNNINERQIDRNDRHYGKQIAEALH